MPRTKVQPVDMGPVELHLSEPLDTLDAQKADIGYGLEGHLHLLKVGNEAAVQMAVVVSPFRPVGPPDEGWQFLGEPMRRISLLMDLATKTGRAGLKAFSLDFEHLVIACGSNVEDIYTPLSRATPGSALVEEFAKVRRTLMPDGRAALEATLTAKPARRTARWAISGLEASPAEQPSPSQA